MAEDISKILENIGKQAGNIDALTKSLEKLETAKNQAFAAGDASTLVVLNKMSKAVKGLMVTTEQYTAAQEDLTKAQQEGRDLSEEQYQALEKLSKEHKKAARNVQDFGEATVTAHEKMQKANAETEAKSVQFWKTHKKVGKTYEFLTGSITKYIGGLTALGLATKAWKTHVQATELRQNLLIQSYRGLGKAVKNQGSSLEGNQKGLKQTAHSLGDVIGESEKYNAAIRKAEGTAHRMGVSTDVISDSMLRFGKITGVTSAETLGTLTEGAISVSRVMGITVPEAIDFVSLRMDKFGGSAASAIMSLNKIQAEAEDVNIAFRRTVIRSGDVVRILSDISRQTNMYAIDQRFVGNILRENIARLQSTGDSYETAQKKASAFAKAVTGQAPEWMQIFAGQDVTKQLMAGFTVDGKLGKELTKEIGDELNAAQPGLAKKVEGVLKRTDMGYYSKMRLLQEMTSGTSLGIEAMNKQILKLAKHPQGIIMLAQQLGISHAEAYGVVEQAENMEKQSKLVNDVLKGGAEVAAKQLNITTKQAEELFTINKTEVERKKAVQEIVTQKSLEAAAQDDIARKLAEEIAQKEKVKKIEKKIEEYKKSQAASTDAGYIKSVQALIDEAEEEKLRAEAKEKDGDKQTQGLKAVENATSEHKRLFKEYADATGNRFSEIISELSTTRYLIIAALGLGFLKMVMKYTGVGDRIVKTLAMRATGGSSKLAKLATTGGIAGGMGASGKLAGAVGGMMGMDEGTTAAIENVADMMESDIERKETGEAHKTDEKKKGKAERTTEGASGKEGVKRKSTGTGDTRKPRLASRLGSRAKSAASSVGKKLFTIDTASFSRELTGGAAKFSKTAFGAGIALKLAGDMFGDQMGSAGKDLERIDKSWVGMTSNVTSALGMMPGPIGALSQAFEGGVAIGKVLNTGLDALGITSEKVGEKMASWAEGDGPFAKLLRVVSGSDMKSKKETDADFDKMRKSDTEAMKNLEGAASKFGLSVEKFLEYEAQATEKGMNVTKLLEEKGIKRIDVPTKSDMKQAKQTKDAQAPISPATAKALGLPGATPGQPTQAGMASAESAAATGKTATAAAATGSQDAMPASFVGGLAADGSVMINVMLKADNFMDVFSQAQTKAKKGIRKSMG